AGADLGQVLQQAAVTGGVERVQVPGVGDQSDPEVVAAQVGGDAGGGGHRPLEAGGGPVATVPAGPPVQHHGRAALPRLLLPAHHQAADTGGRAPVHPPQVVAVAVLADGRVVLAVDGHR